MAIPESLGILMTIVINIPFGYWRKKTKRFSKEWFLAIHSVVPIVFLLRFLSNTPITHIPIFFVAFFTGQFIGGRIHILTGFLSGEFG